MPGHPMKFTQARQDAILERLKAGSTRSAAAESVGVHRSQMTRWVEKHATFATAVLRAEAEAEIRYTALFAKGAQEGDWRAAESWLKRRRPEEWGDRLDVRQLSDELLVRFLNRAADQRGAPAEHHDSAGALAANGKH